MSASTASRFVDFAMSHQVSGPHYHVNICFFGGEPFLCIERMSQIVNEARHPRPNVYKTPVFTATTSGVIATPEVERVVKDAHMSLLISLDGDLVASRSRPLASGRDSYPVVARNLPRLVSWTHEAVVRMTFHPGSLDLVSNVRHALELGAPSVALCPVEEVPWETHEAALEESYQALADWYIEEARRGTILPLEITHLLLASWHAAQHGAPRPARPCGVGTSLLGVAPNGQVLPCHRFIHRRQDALGHVSDDALRGDRSRYLHLASSRLLGCDQCSARQVCGGGCRAVVLEQGGDFKTGTTPGYCVTTRAHHRAVVHIYDTLMAEGNPAFLRILNRSRSSPLTALYTQ